MLRRVKVYDRRKVGHPVGELAKGQRVEVKVLYPPDERLRYWAELADGNYIVVDAPRGRMVKLLIGVQSVDG